MKLKIYRDPQNNPFLKNLRKQMESLQEEQKEIGKIQRSHHWRESSRPKLKRTIDILLSVLAILTLVPIYLVVAILIKLEDRGPFFFKQVRVGLNGRPFTMLKFRSMRQDADQIKHELTTMNEHERGVTFKIKNDPRITKIGYFIRKYSIDELPQFFNVIQGSMSLVGPRPAVPSEVQQYQSNHIERLRVKPGITCIWQVSGRANIDFEGQVEMDKSYVRCPSLWRDFLLLLKTIPAVLFAKGSY